MYPILILGVAGMPITGWAISNAVVQGNTPLLSSWKERQE